MPRQIPVLLVVDDRPADAFLMRKALERHGPKNVEVKVAVHGRDAISMVELGLRPQLILLDLIMPVMDGHEFLAFRKTDALLRKIPVLVLTTSPSPSDIVRAYEQGANSYLKKPVGRQDLDSLVQVVSDFWLDLAELPEFR